MTRTPMTPTPGRPAAPSRARAPRLRAALAALCAGAACAAAGPVPTERVGVAAVLSARPLVPAQIQRSMLMGVARAGDRLVAVGEHGGIALSDDHGVSWRSASTVPTGATLTAVRFADARVGWAVGHLGVVLRTEDGGETWRQQLDGIALAKLAQAQAGGDIAEAQRLVDDGPDKPWLDLLVDDAQHVTVVGAFSLAVRSDDGGQHWRVVSTQFTNPKRLHWYGIARVAGRLFGVGEQALIAAQAESGAEAPLTTAKAPYEGSLFGVLAAGGPSALVYGLRGHAFVSRDGGAHWQRSRIGGSSGASINAGFRLNDGRIALGDQAGNLFVSVDGGANFERASFTWGAPLTGIAETGNGGLVLSSLGGIAVVPRSALGAAQPSNIPAVPVQARP